VFGCAGNPQQARRVDFDTAETVMEFDEVGKILRIVPTVRNDAHRLIEECMLAANVCAAGFLIENEHPALYRIHAGPSEEKLDGLRAMLKDFALQLPGGKQPKPADYSALLAKIKNGRMRRCCRRCCCDR
jgi:ribonuclease R